MSIEHMKHKQALAVSLLTSCLRVRSTEEVGHCMRLHEAPQRLLIPRLRLHGGWMEAVWDSWTVCEGLGLVSV